jgi:polygalacturonase
MQEFFRRRDTETRKQRREDIYKCSLCVISASLRLCVKILAFSVSLSAADFNVATYGATGNGRALDTAAIQKAIDAASAAGGGIVYFPTGRFLSGTITLKNDITVRLSAGAVLLASTRMEDYQPKHLIYAQKVGNVAIEGPGAIDGQGDAFFDKNMQPLPRPSPLIEIGDSNGIRFQDVTIRKAPGWTVHTKNCNNVLFRAISLINNLRAINTDGLDIDSASTSIPAATW